MIDAHASLPHYAAHLQPIWDALPAEVRGTFWSPSRKESWGVPLTRDRDPSRLVLVASAGDGQSMGGSRLVLADHGAGQGYVDGLGVGNASYAGGRGHERVVLFLCPSEQVAARWRAVYPSTPAVVVGCPRLDRHHLARVQVPAQAADQGIQAATLVPTGAVTHAAQDGGDRRRAAPSIPLAEAAPGSLPGVPVVAVTYHFDLGLCAETRSAWRHYDRVLPALAADPRWHLLGHGHPRLWNTISQRWKRLGVEAVQDIDDVYDRADLLVADNSSVLPEAASIGIPVVALNMPSYRRDVEHGGRFWSQVPGLQVDRPADLADGIAHALTDPPALQAMRRKAVAWWYGYTDGHATDRAVAAILALVR